MSCKSQPKGYEIKVKFNNLKNKEIYLAYHLGNEIKIADTAKINDKGEAIFKKRKTLEDGMYCVYINKQKYFDIIVGNDQVFEVEIASIHTSRNTLVKGSKENTIFENYLLLMEKRFSERGKIMQEIRQLKSIENLQKLAEFDKKTKKQIEQFAKNNKGTFVANFIKSTIEKETPQSIKGKTNRYNYYHKHYFDNIDFSDSRMMRTPTFQYRLLYYFQKVAPLNAKDLISEIDNLVAKTKHDKKLYEFVLSTIFNYFENLQIMGMDAVFVHIAENYYIAGKADWITKDYKKELKEKVRLIKPNLIGKPAPELKIKKLNSDKDLLKNTLGNLKKSGNKLDKLDDNPLQEYVSLHQIIEENNYTILWFWEADCYQCQAFTPKLHQAYIDSLKTKGIEIMAVNLKNNPSEWINFILKKDLTSWTNVWDKNNETQYRDLYNANTSPIIYVIDKNKKIIAKKIGYLDAINLIYSKIEAPEFKILEGKVQTFVKKNNLYGTNLNKTLSKIIQNKEIIETIKKFKEISNPKQKIETILSEIL